MTLFRANGRSLYFAHIPKTGGSSLGTTIHKSGAKRALHHKSNLEFTKAPMQHMHAYLYTRLIPKEFCDYTIAVVRDPAKRMMSEYKYQIALERTSDPFDAWLDQMLSDFERDPFCHQNHIRPQHEFIAPRTKVFRFEDGLEKPLNFACDKLKLKPAEMNSLKRSKTSFEPSAEALAKIRAFYARDYDLFGYA